MRNKLILVLLAMVFIVAAVSSYLYLNRTQPDTNSNDQIVENSSPKETPETQPSAVADPEIEAILKYFDFIFTHFAVADITEEFKDFEAPTEFDADKQGGELVVFLEQNPKYLDEIAAKDIDFACNSVSTSDWEILNRITSGLIKGPNNCNIGTSNDEFEPIYNTIENYLTAEKSLSKDEEVSVIVSYMKERDTNSSFYKWLRDDEGLIALTRQKTSDQLSETDKNFLNKRIRIISSLRDDVSSIKPTSVKDIRLMSEIRVATHFETQAIDLILDAINENSSYKYNEGVIATEKAAYWMGNIIFGEIMPGE